MGKSCVRNFCTAPSPKGNTFGAPPPHSNSGSILGPPFNMAKTSNYHVKTTPVRWPQSTISVFLTPFSVLLTLFSVLCTICSLLLTPFSVLCTQAPIAIAMCLETLSDGCSSGSSRKRKQEVWDVVIHYIKLNLVIAVSFM